jgi:hypothetical protein
MSSKTPNPKTQTSGNLQTSIFKNRVRVLVLDDWSFPGAWGLVLGIFVRAARST